MITMSDIAKQAGVSRATASLVLNGRDADARISASTRQRVLAVAEQMGYRRNELARAVVTGRNFVLGLVERQGGLEQKARIVGGALQAAEARGYQIKVWSYPDPEKMAELSKRCVEQRLAGLMVIRPAYSTDEIHKELLRYQMPMVLVDDGLAEPWAINIGSDDRQGVRQAMEHLIGLGHRRIACITGTPVDSLSTVREQSYREIMAQHGFPVPDGDVSYNGWSLDATEECVTRLFSGGLPRPTALFVATGDPHAGVALRTLRALGLRVPTDVSVVGYADLTLAQIVDPPLTTVSQPFADMGSVAVEVLLSLIAGDPLPMTGGVAGRLLPTQLVVRKSTGMAPAFPPL
jgi:DNA-binding LacI/PurR family transcriptional regulator